MIKSRTSDGKGDTGRQNRLELPVGIEKDSTSLPLVEESMLDIMRLPDKPTSTSGPSGLTHHWVGGSHIRSSRSCEVHADYLDLSSSHFPCSSMSLIDSFVSYGMSSDPIPYGEADVV